MRRNLPLTFVAKDATLFNLAFHNPQSHRAMVQIEGVDSLDIRHKGKAMLKVIEQVNALPDEQLPEQMTRLDTYPNYKTTFKAVNVALATQSNGSEFG